MPDDAANSGQHDSACGSNWVRRCIDLAVTLMLWGYFTLGFIVFFSPWYVLAMAFPGRRRSAYQALNHYFYRGFFGLCRLLIPRHHWQVAPSVAALRSAVVVCNHISYIDSILLISLFKRHTTIVKARLLTIPIFGMMLRLSGYIPSEARGRLAEMMVQRLETLGHDLAGGANLFIFPEGTRSRNGQIGRFNPGAFKIARMCRLPIHVIRIRNSDRLFTPGRFLFNTGCDNTITIEVVGRMTPDYDAPDFSMADLMERARRLMLTQAV